MGNPEASAVDQIPISFASCSIGYDEEKHTLDKKLQAIAAAGFSAIELSMPDILTYGKQLLGHEIEAEDFDTLVKVAQSIKALCGESKLVIMMLQPFANFEGWPDGSTERRDAFRRAEGWIRIMEACGTDLLQVGSSDTPAEKIGTDRNRFVNDLRELADMLAKHSFRLAYENWCWSTHAPLWQDVWDIVQKVDRPNIGLCLDTFQTAGGEWGDPTTQSGLIETKSRDDLAKAYKQSMENLSSVVSKEKIYLLQISDAYKPRGGPLNTEPGEDGLRSRGRWSHDFRPLPFDGGYLPIIDMAQAVLKTGFRGWFSYEVFDGGADGKGKEYDLVAYAKQAAAAHKQLLAECMKT